MWDKQDNTRRAGPFRAAPHLFTPLKHTMALTSDDVGRIAQLARLELRDEEATAMQAQLNEFFAIVEKMRAVDTSGVEPRYTLSAIEDVTLRLREDAVTETNQREANMANAPARDEGLFLVPKVIE
jgi:aspartyl-tRNA(Asn)/glutamyl-tRNA(Gln) amidotransferase subunit C